MPSAAEIDLMHLPVDDQDFRADPMPYIEQARAIHPWLARTDYGYFIHGYEAMKDVLYMDDKLSPRFEELVRYYQVEGTPWAKFQVEQLIGHTSPKHRRIRMSVGDAFTPRNVNKHIDIIRRNCGALLDEWVPAGKMDFADFVSNFPISVLCGLLGTGTEEIPRLKHSMETQTRLLSMDHGIVPDLLEGYHIMAEFCDRLVAEREAQGIGEEGLLDRLIAVKNSGKIDADELRYLLMVLFPAGYDTSKNMLTLTMYQMLQYPEMWVRCAEDRGYCDKVTEEIFRHTSTATVFRGVDVEFDYDGVSFPKDAMIIFANSLSGRDPRAFEEAMVFNPDRVHANRHVAFGRGAHICLGQHMAKTQIAEGLHMMAQRIRNPRLAGPIEWRPFLGVWGLETLPIEFDPAEAKVPELA